MGTSLSPNALRPAHGHDDRTKKWLENTRSIADLAVVHADESERLHRLADPVADAVKQADVSRMMVPAVYGGHQESLVTAMSVIEELAYHDGSLGWNIWVATGHGRTADYMTQTAAQAVFATGSVLAGNLQPTGTARAVPGGYRLTGQWAFASASSLAEWLISAAPITGGKAADGRVLAFVLPAAECEILDTWHTTGLHATGSQDYRVDDLFVPEEFTFPAELIFQVLPASSDVAYGRPYSEYSSVLMSAVGLGIARHAIDAFRDMVMARRHGSAGAGSGLESIQYERIGRAEALYQSSRSWLYEVGHQLAELGPGDPNASLRGRHAGAHVAKSCQDAVDLLYDIAGRSAIYSRFPLERCFRDVHMVTHHATIAFGAFVDAGEALSTP